MTPEPGKTDRPATKPWERAKPGGTEQDPSAARFVQSLGFDQRLYKHDIAGSVAHARILRAAGLIDDDDLSAIEQGLRQIGAEIEAAGIAGWSGWRTELEDVHMCIEAALIEKTGDAGRKLHTGRSRNDQVALDLKLWIRDANHQLCGLILDLQRAFMELADRDGRIVTASYTHMQRAQPAVVGAELLAWIAALDRAGSRIKRLTVSWDNPLGSGAGAGSSLPLDRGLVSDLLPSLSGVSENSIDATASRDAAIDFVYGLAMISMTLSRWAEQWIIYMTSEFGFLKLGDAYTTGSSMMPQKRNPDLLELIRGRCGGVYGHLTALLTICKGLSVGYNRDLQEDKVHVFGAFDTVRDCLGVGAGIVRSARFDRERIAQDLDRGFLDATSLAEYLVTRGVPFRTAHQMVGDLVRNCESKGYRRFSQLSLDELNSACGGRAVCDPQVYDWLGPANVVKRYRTGGNAGLTGFEQQLAGWTERLAADQGGD